MINLISKRFWFLGFSGTLVLVSLILVALLGLRQGIDLKGGTSWQITLEDGNVNADAVRTFMADTSGAKDVVVKRLSDGSLVLRLPDTNEELHQKYLAGLAEKFGAVQENSFSSIGPAIGAELRQKSLLAIIAVILGISLYIAFAFRKVSQPIRSWKYGIVTLVTLLHDVAIPTGMLALLGRLAGVEIDTNFIVALLVVMGFSVHDTIVVFDRIRENILKNRNRNVPLGDTINFSINETMVRSINTSLTLIIVLFALIFVGPESLFYFILTMLVGTVFGTYSSIFVASPLLYSWRGKKIN